MKMKPLTLFSMLLVGSQLVWADQYCVVGNGTKVDLSRRHLMEVPQDLPIGTSELNLSENIFSALLARRFSRMNILQHLDLSRNKITNIEEEAFVGLHVLCYLDLRGNNMNFCETTSYPASLFWAVPILKVLYLNENKYVSNCNYRSKFYLPLRNIRELSLDAAQDTLFWLTFGSGFTEMVLLEKLTINGGDRECLISKQTFAPFRSSKLHTIVIERVRNIIEGTFSQYVKFDNIIIQNSPTLGLNLALMSLRDLENQNMTSIVFSGLNPDVPDGNSGIQNFYLNNASLKYFANLCVQNIDLSYNNLLGTSDAFVGRFLKHSSCVLNFNFRGNNLPTSDYFTLLYSLFYEYRFPNIKHVDISWTKPMCGNMNLGQYYVDNLDIRQNNHLITFNCSYNARVELRYFKYKVMDVEILDVAYTTYMPSYENQTWIRLKVFNISGCRLTELQLYTAFGVFPELEILVARAIVNFNLERYHNGMPYKVFPKLKVLDIRDNGISYLRPDSFKGLPLETLDVSNNKRIGLSSAITSLRTLVILRLPDNAITKLDISEMRWIEQMATFARYSGKAFTITAEGNPFACICETLNFLHWLLETDVVSGIVNQSTCYFQNGTQISLLDLKDEFKDFSVVCVSQFWLTFAMSMGSVVAVGIVVSIVGYRHRWNIKYWFLTRCRKKHEYEPITEHDYPFDAFVAYNHEDYNWACFRLRTALEEGKKRYRLCLHHRDFPVGESIQQNIVDAVNSSRKIILVITRKYLSCDWGEFEIQMAGMRMVQEGRSNVIIAILLEEIPVRKMPRSLLNIWKHITFLLWKDDPVDERIFWARLLDAMARE